MTQNNSFGTKWGRLTFAAAIVAVTMGLGACGGGGGSDDDGGYGGGTGTPVGDTEVSPSSLQGQWAGTVEPTGSDAGKFRQLYMVFDSNGNITRVDLDGSTLTGVTGTLEGTPTGSGQIFEYTVDGDTLYVYVDAAAEHAGIGFQDGTVGVIEKGASTNPTYDAGDAVGSWSGGSVSLVLDPDLTADGFETPAGSYATSGSDVVSTDLSFAPAGDGQGCTGVEHTLGGFNASYGVYDDSTATGGTGDCPGSEVVPADAYVSADATFMVVLGGCEAADDGLGRLDDCSFAILNKQ